jgi:16S rRNA (guanine966-N2)-methyltransferase
MIAIPKHCKSPFAPRTGLHSKRTGHMTYWLGTHINILAERFQPTQRRGLLPQVVESEISMRHKQPRDSTTKSVDSQLRIIGGSLRGRTVHYNGDAGLRPMKDRTRESVFNLIGPDVVGKTVIDLFAGTGAMAFESLSRGAGAAICIERRFPNARTITETADVLKIGARLSVTPGDTFIWAKRHLPKSSPAWLVFCCPPYEFYATRRDEMLKLINTVWDEAPLGSVFVVESDERFSPDQLPHPDKWDNRTYLPAVISIARKRDT